MVGARGFEPPTPWSRTGVSEKSKALWVSHLQAPSPQKSCLNWSTLVHKTRCSLHAQLPKSEEEFLGSSAFFVISVPRLRLACAHRVIPKVEENGKVRRMISPTFYVNVAPGTLADPTAFKTGDCALARV
jgi:hypothetical protein